MDSSDSKKYLILSIQGPAEIVENLKALGFYQSGLITQKMKIPFHGPIVVEIDSAQFALREEEFKCLELIPCPT